MGHWALLALLLVGSFAYAETPPTKAALEQAHCASLLIELKEDMCLKPGRMIEAGQVASPADLALDAFCADLIIKRAAPHGVVTVFGSARTKADQPDYQLVRRFAALWTQESGGRMPIATGGGPGLMEAANRGARDAGGRSIGFATHFGKQGVEKPNEFTTDSYMFSSFAQREAELVDRAGAVVVATGGFGTEWEIYETISKIQTGKKEKAPVILLGKKSQWRSVKNRIWKMRNAGTISPADVDLIHVAETPEEAVEFLKKWFNHQH